MVIYTLSFTLGLDQNYCPHIPMAPRALAASAATPLGKGGARVKFPEEKAAQREHKPNEAGLM